MKTIQLKDGSMLKGEIIKFENSVYTIYTETFGEIEIEDANILSITSAQVPSAMVLPQQAQQNPLEGANINAQAQQIQNSIMSDPALMESMKNIAENEEIKSILSDPNLIKDIMTLDPKKIHDNKEVQQLMNNPEFEALMNQVNQAIPQK